MDPVERSAGGGDVDDASVIATPGDGRGGWGDSAAEDEMRTLRGVRGLRGVPGSDIRSSATIRSCS